MRPVTACRSCSLALLLLAAPAVAMSSAGVTGSAPLGLPDDLAVAAALLQAEDTRTVSADLEALTRVDLPAVRARAALALGRIGLPSSQPRLLEMSRDPDAGVRSLVAFALGKLEYDLAPAMQEAQRERSVRALSGLLDDVPDVAANAALALGLIGSGRETLQAWLLRVGALRPEQRPPAPAISAALLAWSRQTDPAAQPLAPFTGASDVAVRRAAADALGRLADPNAWPLLLPLLDDPDLQVRLNALGGLHGAPASLAEQRGAPLLRARDWREQCAALRWIGAAWELPGAEPGDAFADVLRRSLDRNLHVRNCALAALAATADRRAVAADRLLEALGEPAASVRATAMRLLARAQPALAREGAKRIRGRFPTTGESEPASLTPPEQMTAVELLAASGREEDHTVLRAALESDNYGLRTAALGAWQRLDPASAWQVSASWLETMTPPLIGAAIEAIDAIVRRGQAPPQPATDAIVEPLWRLFYDSSGPQMAPIRRTLLATLVHLDRQLMSRRWSLLVDQPDRLLRLEAARLLANPGGPRPEFSGAALAGHRTGRSSQQYAALAAEILELQARPARVLLSTQGGSVTLEVRADWAPLTAVQFLSLIQDGFYESTRFQYVDNGFMAQVGARGSAPWSAPSLRSEETPVAVDRGAVGLVLSGRDTGAARFFITQAPAPQLTGTTPIFCLVVDGQRAVDHIQIGDSMSLQRLPQ